MKKLCTACESFIYFFKCVIMLSVSNMFTCRYACVFVSCKCHIFFSSNTYIEEKVLSVKWQSAGDNVELVLYKHCINCVFIFVVVLDFGPENPGL